MQPHAGRSAGVVVVGGARMTDDVNLFPPGQTLNVKIPDTFVY
jgi:hypothetical protein